MFYNPAIYSIQSEFSSMCKTNKQTSIMKHFISNK